MAHPLGVRENPERPAFVPVDVPTPPPPAPPPATTSVTGPLGTFSSPEEAYQRTGIAGYGKSFADLIAARDADPRNQEQMRLREENDARIKGLTGGLDLSQGIWQGMDDYSLTGALGGLANSALGRQLGEALIRRWGSQNEVARRVNQYWAGFIDPEASHNFNYDYWQTLGTLSEMGHDITPYLAAGAKQHSGTWADFGMSDAERQAMANTPASLAAQGLSGITGGLAKNNGGAWTGNGGGNGPLNSPPTTNPAIGNVDLTPSGTMQNPSGNYNPTGTAVNQQGPKPTNQQGPLGVINNNFGAGTNQGPLTGNLFGKTSFNSQNYYGNFGR